MQKLLTIVVPVYKVEAYINKCLDSLLLSPEKMQQLEVIIVNDGTPDNSAELSREYVKRYPETFRQIDKENGGHGSAWNVGLKEATGKYMRFLDSDDWFTNLDRLIVDLGNNDVDVVFNPYIKEFLDDAKEEVVDIPDSSGISNINPTLWGKSHWGNEGVNFWAATYKTEILRPLFPLFAEKTMYDDYILTWAPLVIGRSYMSLDYPIYHYLLGRPGQSMTATMQRKGAISYAKCFAQYELVRAKVKTESIPADFLNRIDSSITEYACLVFSKMVFLSYRLARQRMKYLWHNYLNDLPDKPKLLIRYARLPFFVFYYFEHFRHSIKKS